MILHSKKKQNKIVVLFITILVFLLSVVFVYGQEVDNTKDHFPYTKFPADQVIDDPNVKKDRFILSPASVDLFWQYLKGLMILPRENLIIPEPGNATQYEIEHAYYGPAFSYTTDGVYLATKPVKPTGTITDSTPVQDFKPEYRIANYLKFDPYRDWICSRQDCSTSQDGCIDPEWRFNSKTFCNRPMPMCREPEVATTNTPIVNYTGKVDLSTYQHPTNGQGQISSEFGVARSYHKKGDPSDKVTYVNDQDLSIRPKPPKLDWEYVVYAHEGIDISVPAGTPVRATQTGQVEYVGYMGDKVAYGQFIVIKHDVDGVYSLYGHLTKGSAVVTAGQHVTAGQVIGMSGTSGASTGPHLHFELRKVKANWGSNDIWNPNSWNGKSTCLTSVAGLWQQLSPSDCGSNIDPSPMFVGQQRNTSYVPDDSTVYANFEEEVLEYEGGRVAGMSTTCQDDPYCDAAGYVFFTDAYVNSVANHLKKPQENKYLNMHPQFAGVRQEVAEAVDKFMNDPETKAFMNKCGSCKIGFYQGFRTKAEQAALVAANCPAGQTSCTGYAASGYSQHHSGYAIDMYFLPDGTWNRYVNVGSELNKILLKYTFGVPVGNDPPHHLYFGSHPIVNNGVPSTTAPGTDPGTTTGSEIDLNQELSQYFDGSWLVTDENFTTTLPMCKSRSKLCSDSLGKPSSLGCMIDIIAKTTQVPRELIYSIMMIETKGLCTEVNGGPIVACTGNPLEVAWSAPTQQLATSKQDIRGITQVSVSEMNYPINYMPDELKNCVEAAAGGIPVQDQISQSTNPSLAKDKFAINSIYSRSIVAHSLCFTALKLKRDGAEWNQWKKEPTNPKITASYFMYTPLRLDQWYDYIASDTTAGVDESWPGVPTTKKQYNLVDHIGRRYYGTCVQLASSSTYSRDIYYCKDLHDGYDKALDNPNLFACGFDPTQNVVQSTTTLDCEETNEIPGVTITTTLSKNHVKVLMIGDSQIDLTNVPQFMAEGFKKLEIDAEFLGTRGTDVKHEGMTGASVDSTLERLGTPSYGQELVFIQLGSNDITLTDARNFGNGMSTLISRLKNANSSVVIIISQIPPLVGDGKAIQEKNATINEFNKVLSGLPESTGPNVAYVTTGVNADSDIKPDKIHLNESGAQKTVNAWLNQAIEFFNP